MRKKLKIALIATGLGHIKRGVETWTEDLGIDLNARGINVTVYKGGGKKNFKYEKVVACLQRRNKFSQWLIKRRPAFLWRLGLSTGYTLEQITFCWNILPVLMFQQFDIIHSQDAEVCVFLMKAANLGLIKSKIILCNGTDERPDVLKRCVYIHHIAPFYEQEAVEHQVSPKKSFVIPNFVNQEKFFFCDQKQLIRKKYDIPEDAFVVLSVAAVTRRHKRADHLIREVSRLNMKNVYLLMVGATETDTPEVVSLGKDLLGDRCILLCDFPYSNMPEIYQAADIFVLGSLREMFGIVILEAMATGLPAIVHHYQVSQWIIGDGGDAIDMTVEGCLAAMITEYLNIDYRQNKSSLARARAIEKFSKEKVVDEIVVMYQEVME